jgi:hypothetical protein
LQSFVANEGEQVPHKGAVKVPSFAVQELFNEYVVSCEEHGTPRPPRSTFFASFKGLKEGTRVQLSTLKGTFETCEVCYWVGTCRQCVRNPEDRENLRVLREAHHKCHSGARRCYNNVHTNAKYNQGSYTSVCTDFVGQVKTCLYHTKSGGVKGLDPPPHKQRVFGATAHSLGRSWFVVPPWVPNGPNTNLHLLFKEPHSTTTK